MLIIHYIYTLCVCGSPVVPETCWENFLFSCLVLPLPASHLRCGSGCWDLGSLQQGQGTRHTHAHTHTVWFSIRNQSVIYMDFVLFFLCVFRWWRTLQSSISRPTPTTETPGRKHWRRRCVSSTLEWEHTHTCLSISALFCYFLKSWIVSEIEARSSCTVTCEARGRLEAPVF